LSDQHVPALRRRFLEDMRINGLQPKTQTIYLRAMRDFTRFLGRSLFTVTPEDLLPGRGSNSTLCTAARRLRAPSGTARRTGRALTFLTF
jgi:hypothetical protein